MSNSKVLTKETVNQKVVAAEYAVRGTVAVKAEELKISLAKEPGSFGFKNITFCNIGNPQQLAQKPITFFRQVMALTEYPELMSNENIALTSKIFPSDAIERAKEYLFAVGGSVGAYSHSQGVPFIRETVAKFIEERDGHPSDPNDIFLTAGASSAVEAVLELIISSKNVGIMIPIPQYPLYTATIAMKDGSAVPYYLDESKEWGLSRAELERAKLSIKNEDIDIRALTVINPGNPTGQCLKVEDMQEIVKFCYENNLVLLADEVYQRNIYSDIPFVSFKKVIKDMGDPYDSIELISFHSISKGMIGECGRRGGYMECTNIDEATKALFYKFASVSLCPPVSGQLMVGLMTNPPRKGDPSYDLFIKEDAEIYESLKRRAIKLSEAFNSLEGVSCNSAQGSMYLFPTITLPPNAIKAAKVKKLEPDTLYAIELLEATGVVVVQGSGFGQKKDTFHFRSTFLPPEDQMDAFIANIKTFHDAFLAKYK